MSRWNAAKVPLVIGARVTVWKTHGWEPESAHTGRTIAKCGKLKITLDDGSEWKVSSLQKWGSSGYGADYIAAPNQSAEDEANAKYGHARMSNALENMKWRELPREMVKEIWAKVSEKIKAK